jgi:4-amino-4-deoxy-L-arabinose transferase-like glycosyltransferase
MKTPLRSLTWAALAVLLVCSVYGLVHERLFHQSLWTPEGVVRLWGYTAVFWTAAGLILWLRPRWLGPVAAASVLLYSVWWCARFFEAIAPLAAIYFLGSSFLLGKFAARKAAGVKALLLGLAIWIFAISIAVHFPVNTRPVYAAAFAIPYLLEWRRVRDYWRNARLPFPCESRREAAALAVFLFVLLAHWLVALKPEVGSDGLLMHLAIPMTVAHDRQWGFDFEHYTAALMATGGDWAFTAAYLLGGEAAARLLNFALLVAIAAAIRETSRRWLTPAMAWLAAALFLSTPLAQLTTGSLFVENVWAALALGGALALWRYLETDDGDELALSAVLFGAALSVKVLAGAFVLPAAAIAIYTAARRKRSERLLGRAALWLAIFAAPPYAWAFWATGNPVFPSLNHLFRSPYYSTARMVADPRFDAALSWKTFYEMTFRSARYLEGQGGALGFQYFLLLIPAALWIAIGRRRTGRCGPAMLLGLGACASLLLLGMAPNLRYLYPALPMFSIAIAFLASGVRGAAAGFLTLTMLNLWFLPASGWYHGDFALFRRAQVETYLETFAPQRKLIQYLNRTAPGEPVAFFEAEPGGLNASAYTDTWYSYEYNRRIRTARSAAGLAAFYRELGVRRAIAPVPVDRMFFSNPALRDFLVQWTGAPAVRSGRFGLLEILTAPAPRDRTPVDPGVYDDLDPNIEFQGFWQHDLNFPQTAAHSVTYSNAPGDTFGLSFNGTAIVYVYTKASNRGTARIAIDGREPVSIDLYSRETQWQAQTVFGGLGAGPHRIEVQVLEEKDARSSDRYVDLDRLIVSR